MPGQEDALYALARAAFARAGARGLSGPGDDVARVAAGGRVLVAHTDQVAAGVHVRRGCPPEAMAAKLLRRTLSDIAAAGATPWAALWTVAAPPARGQAWLRRLLRAFLREARRFDVAVIGGDLCNAAAVVLTCTVFGIEGRRPAPGRGGAKPGDLLLVTGRLGGAVRSGRHLRPQPRLEEGKLLVQRYRAHALMDLSDGLATDLPRLLRRSGAGAHVELNAIPLRRGARSAAAALGEGEDYELLAALAPAAAAAALADARLRRSGLTVIGRVTAARRLVWYRDGRPERRALRGYEHHWA